MTVRLVIICESVCKQPYVTANLVCPKAPSYALYYQHTLHQLVVMPCTRDNSAVGDHAAGRMSPRAAGIRERTG